MRNRSDFTEPLLDLLPEGTVTMRVPVMGPQEIIQVGLEVYGIDKLVPVTLNVVTPKQSITVCRQDELPMQIQSDDVYPAQKPSTSAFVDFVAAISLVKTETGDWRVGPEVEVGNRGTLGFAIYKLAKIACTKSGIDTDSVGI